MVVFCRTFGCTSKGYAERKLLNRACFACLSKVVVFCQAFGCTSKGYAERETSLSLFKRERESLFTGLALLASQKGWFSVGLLCAPVGISKGLVGPRSLRSRGPIIRMFEN